MRKNIFKIILTVVALLCIGSQVHAKNGFNIKVKINDMKDSMIYLCYYYGKGGTAQRFDSTYLNKTGEAKFKCDTAITGGIFLLLFKDRSSIEFILRNGDDFTFNVTRSDVYQSAKFVGTTENNLFYDYQRYLVEYSKGYQQAETAYNGSKTKKDSTANFEKLKEKSIELKKFRADFIAKNPNTFMTKIFNAVEEPEIPTVLPTLPSGEKDSLYPRNFYKNHYWDKYDFRDDRLIFTPLYERKLEDYMTKLAVPVADSVKVECDALLKKTRGTKETFKYTLWYLSRWAETSKIMGMDEAFVHLVENYYMKGDAWWLDSTTLAKYIERAQKISPNMIGNQAMDIRCVDSNFQTVPLSSVNAEYTILIFWSPSCGHCQKEMPQFDSLYQAKLKKMGVKFYAVLAENDDFDKWKTYVREHKLNDGWIHVVDPKNTTKFRSFYDVYSTPTVYLLDAKKTIRGKRIDVQNLSGLLDWLEKHKNEIDNKNKIIKK